jgi:hypothetical protein
MSCEEDTFTGEARGLYIGNLVTSTEPHSMSSSGPHISDNPQRHLHATCHRRHPNPLHSPPKDMGLLSCEVSAIHDLLSGKPKDRL